MEKCSSEEMELGLPSMSTIESISQMIYQKTTMDEHASQEPITVFYDGRVYVFDVMELQVRALILIATREMEGEMTSSSSNKEAITLALQSQILGPPCGSVKKSLHTFLKKRNNEASDMYSHNTS